MTAKDYIQKLQLLPHPEGGYFRRIYGNESNGKISTIYYLLENEDFSAFHRLHGMTEIWYFHAGEPLNIYVVNSKGELRTHQLSAVNPQVVIEPEQWFAAEIPSKKGFSLVGCTVAPAFLYENFELAHKPDFISQFPHLSALADRMCKE